MKRRLLVALTGWLTMLICLGASATAQVSTYIRVNQIGYEPNGSKIAIVFSNEALPDQYTVKDSTTDETVFTARVTPTTGKWGGFRHHAELNFSSLARQGRFFILIGTIRSPSFSIRANISDELPDQLLDFMRQQRCGYNPFLDAACHTFDGRTAYGPMPAGSYLNASGGWHDAGDQLKYLLTSSNATAQMLLAYHLAKNKSIFSDHFNGYGQPVANGVPDVLDEARWGLEWMLKLHPTPDQLYHQVADDRDHKGFRLPQNETVDYGWGPGSYRVVYFADGRPQGLKQYQSESTGVANLAGRYAAAMALGYQVWAGDLKSRAFAQTLLKSAIEVYKLGKSKEGVQQGNSYGAPYRYAETTWADDMEWGAAELFRATREAGYLRDAKHYATLCRNRDLDGQRASGSLSILSFHERWALSSLSAR